MNDLEKILKSLEEKLNGLDEKVKVKLDKIDRKLDKKMDKMRRSVGIVIETDDDEEFTYNSGASAENAKGGSVENMAPYLDEESLSELVDKFLNGELEVDMTKVLPYLNEEQVAPIMKKLSESEGGKFKGLTINDVLPYADDDSIDELFLERAKRGIIDKKIASYVSDDCWHKLVLEYCADEESKLNIDEIYPFLDDDDIKLLFKTYIKRQK